MSKRQAITTGGMAIAFLAIAIVALIGIAALAIDVGRLYLAGQRAQDVCDAAALAGAAYLTGESGCAVVDSSSGESTPYDGEAARAAKDAAKGNNESHKLVALHADTGSPGVKVTFPVGTITCADGRTITVKLGEAIQVDCKIHVEHGFARIFGFSATDVGGHATAVLQQTKVLDSDRFAPWVVGDTTIWNVGASPPTPIVSLGTPITLVVSDWPSGILGPGNYGAIAFDTDQGGDDYRDRIAGVAPPVSVTVEGESGGVDVWSEPGEKIGAFKSGLRDRLTKPGEPWPSPSTDSQAWDEWVASYDPDTGRAADTWRLMIVPVIRDKDYGGGRSQLEVVGFAAMFIDSYDASGSDLRLTGRFVTAVSSGEDIVCLPVGQTPSQTNLISGVRLVK